MKTNLLLPILLGLSINAVAQNQDCATRRPICGTAQFTDNNNGSGSRQDITYGTAAAGCLGGVDGSVEHQSSWYEIKFTTSGTFDFTLNTLAGADDYDFAVYGPNPTCPPNPNTPPVRCNYSLTPGVTGLSPAALNNSETSGGVPLSREMTVVAGQTYYILIDNFSRSNSGFDMSFSGTARLDCNIILGADILDFTTQLLKANKVVLNWVATPGKNINYFKVERSYDGDKYEAVSPEIKVNKDIQFSYTDQVIDNKSNNAFYRLLQIDNNGGLKYSKVKSTQLLSTQTNSVIIPTNSQNNKLNITLNGPSFEQGTGQILIKDLFGKDIIAKTFSNDGSINQSIEIDCENLSRGLYIMQVYCNNELISNQKFIY